MLNQLQSFNQSHALGLAKEHGMSMAGLCMGLTAKWCSSAQLQVSDQVDLQNHLQVSDLEKDPLIASSNRLAPLTQTSVIKVVAQEQQRMETRCVGLTAHFKKTLPVMGLIHHYLCQSNESHVEEEVFREAVHAYVKDVRKAGVQCKKALVARFNGCAKKPAGNVRWARLARLLTVPGAYVVEIPARLRPGDADSHAVAALVQKDQRTLFFDPNFGETAAMDSTDVVAYINALKQKYDPLDRAASQSKHPCLFPVADPRFKKPRGAAPLRTG